MPIVAAASAEQSVEQAAAYRAKIEAAEAGRGVLTAFADCLTGYIDNLDGQIDIRQIALGDALKRERQLIEQISIAEGAKQTFVDQIAKEAADTEAKRTDYVAAKAERDAQAARLEECRKWLTIFSFLCDLGESAVRDLGWMANAAIDVRKAEERLTVAQDSLLAIQTRLIESTRLLTEAHGSSAANRAFIAETEESISKAKVARAAAVERVQTYQTRLVDFRQTLDEAGELDLGEARARKIERLSMELDALSSEVPAFVASTEIGLSEDARARCSR